MIPCALDFAADIVPGLEARVKRWRRKEMVGDLVWGCSTNRSLEVLWMIDG